MSTVQNGNLLRVGELRKHLNLHGLSRSRGHGDTQMMLELLASKLRPRNYGELRDVTQSQLFAALREIYRVCQGSMACVLMIPALGIVGFRDAHGIKPLILGERQYDDGSVDFMFSSESVALSKLGFDVMRNVKPGEWPLPPTMPGKCTESCI